MHYYRFNIKDWTRDTAHLSVEEEGVYRRLLDLYYDSESPIPVETQPVIRRLRLAGHEEAVSVILGEFFELGPDGYRNTRCDEEIAKYHAKAEANRENGKKGGRPEKPKENPDGFELEPTDNLNHLTNNQEPVEIKSSCDQQAGSQGQINGSGLSYTAFKDAYNRICVPTLSACRAMSKKRQTLIKSLVNVEIDGVRPFRKHGIPFVEAFFTDCLKNPHWTGNNERGWKANFDFLIRLDNAIRVLEENL